MDEKRQQNETYGRSQFIPYRRNDIVEMCVQDGKLNPEEQELFRKFCKIIIAYYHHIYHEHLIRLKDYFLPLDPDSSYKQFLPNKIVYDEESMDVFFTDFEHLLQKANYRCLSEEEIQASFSDKTLIQLNYGIDFDEIHRYVIYYRGIKPTRERVKQYLWFEKEIDFDLYERVILVLKFKDEDYFRSKKAKLNKLNFQPGRTYIYYYKNIPVNDLEILFPNVRIRMTWFDRLMFFIPAIGAGVGSLWKVLSNIVIVVGFILIYLGLQDYMRRLNIEIDEATIRQSIYPVLLAASSILMVLGGFAIKQYLKYKNKYIHFMKMITDTLFFRNISVNAGVFQTLLDSAEEEECEEAILAYYHLLTSEKPLTRKELDRKIEEWFRTTFDVHMDFDVEDALEKLKSFHRKIHYRLDSGEDEAMEAVIEEARDGTLSVKPLKKTLEILDSIWDDLFQFDFGKEKNSARSVEGMEFIL